MISVCIATYNGEEYIKEQLSSIISQLHDEDEIIISDDGSTDHTLSLIHSFNDTRIKIINGPKTNSPIDNFENALKASSGNYIFLSDQDDIWIKNKVEINLRYLQDYDCVISDCCVVDKNMDIISDSFYKMNNTKKGLLYNLVIKNGYLGCCMSFNRRVLNKCLPFPKNIPMHDIWIGNVSAFYYKTIFISDRLINFRRHGNNASPTAEKSTYSFLRKIQFRYNIVKNILLLNL
jgi:glycosyltransferase involved in cell wall biosynthesis